MHAQCLVDAGTNRVVGFSRLVKLGVGALHQIVGVALLAWQAQLHALEVDARGVLGLAEILGGDLGPDVAGLGVGFHPVPQFRAGVQIIG